MTNEVRMTNVQNPGQDGDVVLISFGLRNSSFLRHWVLRHSSFISGRQVQSGAVQLDELTGSSSYPGPSNHFSQVTQFPRYQQRRSAA